jgi:hypothetical protein
VRRSRRITIIRPVALVAAAGALSLPAVATAAPTHPPDPVSVARAVANHQSASFGSDHGAPARPDPAAVARAVGRYYASFGDEQPIGRTAPAAGPASASSQPDGPTWAAALVAGALAALAAAGLGVAAGRRSIRVRHG